MEKRKTEELVRNGEEKAEIFKKSKNIERSPSKGEKEEKAGEKEE